MKYRTMAMKVEEVDYVNTFKNLDYKIILDEKRNAFDTWQRKLLSVEQDRCLLMEDDILLCDDFLKDVHNAINTYPEEVITFFTLKNIEKTSKLKGRTFVSNLCYYLPKGMASELYDYSFEWLKTAKGIEHPTGCDYCLSDYLKKIGKDYYVWYPNLVQHKQQPSRLGPRSSKRQSKIFKGDLL